MKICMKCKTVRPGSTYCSKCGSKLEDPPECDCGEPVYPDEKFCPGCGEKVTQYGKK